MNIPMHSPAIMRGIWSVGLLCVFACNVMAQAPSAAASNPVTVSAPQASEQTPAPPTQTQAPQAAEMAGTGTDFPVFRTIGGFAVVLSLILIAFLVVRKIAPQYFNKRSAERNLKVIETMPVGEKRSISLIQVGEKSFLIGNTPHQITLLSALDNSFSLVTEAEKRSAAEPLRNAVNPFRRFYETEKNRGAAKSGKEKTIPPDVRAKMRQLREALEG